MTKKALNLLTPKPRLPASNGQRPAVERSEGNTRDAGGCAERS